MLAHGGRICHERQADNGRQQTGNNSKCGLEPNFKKAYGCQRSTRAASQWPKTCGTLLQAHLKHWEITKIRKPTIGMHPGRRDKAARLSRVNLLERKRDRWKVQRVQVRSMTLIGCSSSRSSRQYIQRTVIKVFVP